jgi:ABC-type branched-subunit amino acid transport system ATPase component
VDLPERSACAIYGVIDGVGRAAIAAVQAAVGRAAGGPQGAGQTTLRHVYWYGRQQGEVALSDRKLKVRKPRLRRRGVGVGG